MMSIASVVICVVFVAFGPRLISADSVQNAGIIYKQRSSSGTLVFQQLKGTSYFATFSNITSVKVFDVT